MSETPESPFTPDSTTSCGMRRTCLKHELGIVEIGTFASLLITFLLWLWKLPGEAQALMIQQYAALLAALCYTFCGLWVIEARYLGELDKLHFWWQRHLEKFLRFSIVTFLPFAASSLDSEHSLLLFGASTLLLAIYLAFLAWDAVVYFGGRKEVVKEFWVFDVLCVGLALICWTATSPLSLSIMHKYMKPYLITGYCNKIGSLAVMALCVLVLVQFFKSIKPLKLGVKKGEFCSIVFLTGIAIGLLAFFGSCSRNPNSGTVVRVGIATWPGFASGMVGQKKGFFGDIDVQSRVIDDIPARHAAFQSGDIDIMVSSVDQSVHEYAGGLKGKIILVTDESAGGDGIVANPDIKTAADLRGKKIAFAQTTPSHYLLFKVLEKAGMSPDDVEQVKVDDPGNAGQAFLGGKVDAAVTWEPLLTQVRESTKGHLLASTKEFPETVVDILIASPKLLAKPEVLKRFISGWLKSVDDIKEHPQEDSKIIAKGLGMKLEDAAGTMAGLQFADAKKNGYFFSPNPAECPLSKVFRDAGGFWKRQKLIQNVPAAEEVIEPSILQMLPASPAPGN